MPLALVWPAAASAFAGKTVTEYDLTQLLATDAAPYVIEALDAYGRSVYRLYHQALADDLRLQAQDALDTPAPAPSGIGARPRKNLLAVMFERLHHAAPHAADGSRDWQHADPYLLDHLPAHAAEADRVHVLLDDVGYLVHAEPAPVLPVLNQAKTPARQLAAAIFRGCVEQLQGVSPETRRWAVAASAARFAATEFKERLRPAIIDGLWPRWSTGSPQPALVNTFGGQISPVRTMACTTLNDRPVVVTGSFDPMVRVWDLSSGQQVAPPLKGHTAELMAVACTARDGRPIAVTGGWDGALRIWDLDQGQQISEALTAFPDHVTGIACAVVNGKPVAVCGDHNGLHTWDLTCDPLIGERFQEIATSVTAVDCCVLDGRPIAVAGAEDGTVWIVDLSSRRLLGEPIEIYDYAGEVQAVACTILDGRPVAVIVNAEDYLDSTIWTWDLARGREIGQPFHGHSYARVATCAMINGRPAAITMGHEDGVIHSWDLASHQRIGRPIQGPVTGGWAIASTMLDSRPVAITGSNENVMQVWDLSRQRQAGQSLPGHDNHIQVVTCTTLNGHPIAVTTSFLERNADIWDLSRMWDLVSMKLLREWPTHGEISSLSSSTDGALVLGVGSDVLVADIY